MTGSGGPRAAASFFTDNVMNKIIVIRKLVTAAAIVIPAVLYFVWLQGDKKITDVKDYAAYLKNDGASAAGLKFIDAEITFWNQRLQKNPGDIVSETKLAKLYSSRYHYSGNIDEIKKSDSIYKKANLLQSKTGSGVYRALAANCVTQHRFKQAQLYLDSALALGDDKILSLQQQFDVALELGDEALAKGILYKTGGKNDFSYLVRKAKYSDHAEGDLDGAIAAMETALDKIIELDNKELYCWAKTNLGDMYSHANMYSDAYRCYTDVLKKDNHYYHALKGIAWLAFSHDKDTEAAKKILTWLQQNHPVPDYELMLAQIAACENDTAAEKMHIDKFIAEVQRPAYGDMYNKYLFYLYSDKLNNPDMAMKIALTEVNNRPTGESYNLLCWAYYKKGDLAKALQTAKQHVENKCFEPDAVYHLGVIYKAAGEAAKAKKYLKDARESSFELGPWYADQIQKSITKTQLK
jgi:tetratricopeptide (TPR) repeat protein